MAGAGAGSLFVKLEFAGPVEPYEDRSTGSPRSTSPTSWPICSA